MSKLLLYLGNLYFENSRTGVGAYQGNIIWGLRQDYDIIVPDEYTAPLPTNAHPIKISRIKRKSITYTRNFLPVDAFFKGYDYVITGGTCFKKSKHTKQIPICHDLMSLTEPQNYTLKQRIFARIHRRTLKNAYKVIAVSQTTKQALHELCHIPYSNIPVIPNVTDFFVKNEPQNYFLFIGDMRKTKNLVSLVKGFAEYRMNHGGKERLVIAGNQKFEYENIRTLAEALHLSEYVVFPGYVSEEKKRELFSGAKAFVFLSDNEGFGIPLLEAGVNKIPVLCSDIPVFHEVLNDDYAIFVDNKSAEKIAAGLCHITEKKISETAAEVLAKRYSKTVFDTLINEVIGNKNS